MNFTLHFKMKHNWNWVKIKWFEKHKCKGYWSGYANYLSKMSIIRQVEICQCKNSFHEFTFYDHRNGKSILENSKLLRTCIFLKIMFIFHTNAKTYIKWIFHSVCYHLLLYCKLHSIIQGWSFKIPHLVFAHFWSTNRLQICCYWLI